MEVDYYLACVFGMTTDQCAELDMAITCTIPSDFEDSEDPHLSDPKNWSNCPCVNLSHCDIQSLWLHKRE